jgi:hypothetical protein
MRRHRFRMRLTQRMQARAQIFLQSAAGRTLAKVPFHAGRFRHFQVVPRKERNPFFPNRTAHKRLRE